MKINGDLIIEGTNKQLKTMASKTILQDGIITPTDDFLDNRRIYRKRIVYTGGISGSGTGTAVFSHGINNFLYAWVDGGNSFIFTGSGDSSPFYYRCLPLVNNYYTSVPSKTSIGEQCSITLDQGNIILMSNGGWGSGWYFVITICFVYQDGYEPSI